MPSAKFAPFFDQAIKSRHLSDYGWRDTTRGFTHPDMPDEFYTLEQAYEYQIKLES